ncbi:hypothetical protein ES705_05275 [subsurface metagenome]|nr:hypothetical protein [Clostridia bacterium]
MNLPNLKSYYCDLIYINFGFIIKKSIPRNLWNIFEEGTNKLERYFYYIYRYGKVKLGILTVVSLEKTKGKKTGLFGIILRINPPARKNRFHLRQIDSFFDFFIKNQKKFKNLQIRCDFGFPTKKFTSRVELPYPKKLPEVRKNILQVSGIEFRRYLSEEKYDRVRIRLEDKGKYYFVRINTSGQISFDKYFFRRCLENLYDSAKLLVESRR